MNGETTTRVDDMSCDDIAAHAIAERYVLAELSESDRDAYERHYFDCARCFEELSTVRALRAELTVSGSTPGSHPASARTWWPIGLAAAAIIVTGIGLWTMWPTSEAPVTTARAPEPPEQPALTATPAAPQPSTPADAPVSLEALARFDPPAYEAPVLRGPENEARKLFQAAMTDYLAGAHAKAVDGLRSAAGKDPLAADASFFLGASLLLTKQTQAGITELRRTIALGNTPYLEEAHFYLAKGLLQGGNISGASRELRAMIALGGDRQREAKQLLSDVERTRKGR
jgi:hypothetical protein